ncbi:probable maltase-glucoamylase 2 isoform X2 [Bolinopsis microptera]
MEIDLERIDALDSIFPDEVKTLKCIISYETDSRLRVKIFDPAKERYEVPMSSHHEVSGHRMQYILTITRQMFGFSVSRTHEATSTIFNTTMEGLIFSDQLLQLNMALSSSNVYGLSGDHKDGLLRKMEFNYQSVWATSVEKRHGAHPFLLHVEKDGHASGFFLQNSNAMDVVLSPYPSITFRTSGGILDFYIFLGPTPAEVMAQFSDKIGKPFLPPLWALGYHFGSENFQTDEEISALVNSTFPLDGVWVGKSTLEENMEFTVDAARYPNIEDTISDLHNKEKVLLVDTRPAILLNSSLYDENATNFVRDSANKTIIAKVAGGEAALPDYFHPATLNWLQGALTTYRSALSFAGLFIDENEPSTLSDGSVGGCSNTDSYDDPIYRLRNVPKLKKKTLCPSARHHGGLRHYDVHNIYGWKSSAVTNAALSGVIKEQRSLLLSRSTYLGSGVHTGHFIKENKATWEDMRHSIVAMLNYNMYGIPLVGANICGYKIGDDPDEAGEELCVRWHQLATFYPLAKRYPAVETQMLNFGNDTVKRIQDAVELRYKLLPTLYTLFYSAHTRGLTVVSPLFFDYLDDKNTLSIETQFMFGTGIMFAPVLKPGVTEHEVYFPKDLWYDYNNPNNVIDGVNDHGLSNQSVSLDKQTYYARGGHIIVTHFSSFSNTKETNEKGDYVLDVYLSASGQSYGELYTDDGVSMHTITHDQFLYVKFNASQEHLRSEVTLRFPGHDNKNKIQEINIRGLTNHTKEVVVGDSTDLWENFTFQDGVLCVKSLELPIVEAFMLTYR